MTMPRKTIRNVKSLQNMLNNHSDFVFLVNESSYKASRCVVAGASDVFEALVNGAFQESQKREIEIKDITHDASFYNILAYIYGHDLDFRVIAEDVLCEMLRLTHMYNLQDFYTTLKDDLNQLEYFHDGSAVQLINTAKLYDLKELYERVKTYLCENCKYMLQHESFVNIEHGILVELVKSSTFHDKEINIFRAILKWIQENCAAMSDATKKDALIIELLKSVRFQFISLIDYYRYKLETDSQIKLFSKYKKLLNDAVVTPVTEPRVLPNKYKGLLVKFTAKKHAEDWDKCYFSPVYEVKGIQWKLIVNIDPKNTNISILLDAKPTQKCEYWESVVEYSFKVSSKKSTVSKERYSYQHTFSLSESQPKSFTVDRYTFLDACVENDSFEVELCVKPHDPVFA